MSPEATSKFDAIKAARPRLRRTRPVAIIHSGGSQTIFNCILCGEHHTCATAYRDVKHVAEFKTHHNAGLCVEKNPQ